MTILQSSMIFARASDTYSQLRYIVGLYNDQYYVDLLKNMDAMYHFADTELNRAKLKEFLDAFAEDIREKAADENEAYRDFYDLK